MANEYIGREAVLKFIADIEECKYEPDKIFLYCQHLRRIPAADVVPVARCGKDRLTKLGANGIYGLAKVKDNEQEVDSPYPNTLKAILEAFQRLAEYENTGLSPSEIPLLQTELSKEKKRAGRAIACIHDVEDHLDRMGHNDWASQSIEEWERSESEEEHAKNSP